MSPQIFSENKVSKEGESALDGNSGTTIPETIIQKVPGLKTYKIPLSGKLTGRSNP